MHVSELESSVDDSILCRYVTTACRVLALRMEETACRFGR
jgi:hypothetical protein